jgi:copper chaperone CopZ
MAVDRIEYLHPKMIAFRRMEMKRFAPVLVAAGFAVTLAGCQPTAVSQTPTSNTSQATSSEFTLVTLKVPNMVWGGCAASVRGDLEKIDGVTDIETDISGRSCSFKVTDPDVDYNSKLAEFAKSNEHLAEYSVQ